MNRPRIVIADDHALVAEGIRRLLEPEFDVLRVVMNGRELVDAAQVLAPVAIVLDVSMPVMNGIAAAQLLREQGTTAKLVFLSQHADRNYAEAAFQAGGDAYVIKQAAADELLVALRTVLRGERYVASALAADAPKAGPTSAARRRAAGAAKNEAPKPDELTTQQLAVLDHIGAGKSRREMAELMQLSERAVAFHERGLLASLGLANREELNTYARQHARTKG